MRYSNIKYKLSKNALIMFVGINPHPGSYKRKVPFSNNKMFWYLLSRAHIIEEPTEYLMNDKKLVQMYEGKFVQEYRLNFINLVDRPTSDVSKLRKGEERPGAARVFDSIRIYKPRLVCFIGKITYEKFSGSKHTDYGYKQPIYGISTYVCRFPIRGPAIDRIKELKALIKAARGIDARARV
ncbi:MAG: hypothetical protein LVQ97_04010 [Candidatus Micrarchaeales archaeon]|nr:hypothetical protein [Candidatus Micrarchaeales archaeon]